MISLTRHNISDGIIRLKFNFDPITDLLLQDPSNFFKDVVNWNLIMNRSREMLYQMIEKHFALKRNADGTAWKPNTEFTKMLKSLGIARLKPFRASKYNEELKASGDYYNDLTRIGANNLHKFEIKEHGGRIVIGSSLPQVFNEFVRKGAGAIKPSEKNDPIPARQVLFIDDDTIDDVLDLLEDNIFLMLGRR